MYNQGNERQKMKLTVAQYQTILAGLLHRENHLQEMLSLNSDYVTENDRKKWQTELDSIKPLVQTVAMASVQESIG
jgi:hypothetical protein